MTAEPALQHTPILGNAEYEAALDSILERATRSIRIFDHALSAGYNSPKRFEILRSFILASRRNQLQIVVHNPQTLDRNCPRLLVLLRTYGYAINIHETHLNAKSVYDPFAVVDDGCFVHRFHFEEMRGLLGTNDPIGTHTLAERFSEIWESSSPAVSATTLGL